MTDDLQAIEVCVPACRRAAAVAVLAAQHAKYDTLPDLDEPDFYHPHKRGAARFEQRNVKSPWTFLLVTDEALRMDMSNPNTFESGLTYAEAHKELIPLCEGVSDDVLTMIKWPTLASFLNGWLALAAEVDGQEMQMMFLMQAERLIDSNNVDSAWLSKVLTARSHLELALELLKGKERRIAQSTWY